MAMPGGRNRIARIAPVSARGSARAESEARLLDVLQKDFAVMNLTAAPTFILFVEGATDRGYILRAAGLFEQAFGVNPLDIPPGVAGSSPSRISVLVPGEPGKQASGGVARMGAAAASLFQDFFKSEVPNGLLFLFDHDYAGRKERDAIKRYGFLPGTHSLTLDPLSHPSMAGRADVVIEDLLPLSVQSAFFDQGGASCSKEYRMGELTRIKWEHPSKAALRKFVCEHEGINAFDEMIVLISRVRSAFGFPQLPRSSISAGDV